MNRILAVVKPTDTDVELLEEAGAVAAGTGVEVVVLALVSEGSEDASVDSIRQWDGFDATKTDETAETVNRFAEYLGSQILDPFGVEYLAVGERIETTRPSSKIIDVAENHDCDHVYVSNRGRSPTGKALFGDTTQSVILNFDGFVTVRTA
ncbi:universal stress protein [Haladaptatus cibarius]|uniref:universal stress protein n=1 Tax=Haladaptatus cibarius TaxID=453847 RepID=UPI0006794C3C|nr:universal stress protein [Haladaptatus cibarius]